MNSHWITIAGITIDEFQKAIEQARNQVRSGYYNSVFLIFDERVEIRPNDWYKILKRKSCPMEID